MHKTKILLKSAFPLNEDFNNNLSSFSLLSKLSNAQKDIEDEKNNFLTNDEEESKNLNAKAISFTSFLQTHIHGMELSAVPKFAYDIKHNNSNANEARLIYNGEIFAETEDFYILSNNESTDINDYYYIIENEQKEIENNIRIKNPSEYGYDYISLDNFFGLLIESANKHTSSNEKLFKCIKYLKKAGE